MTDDPNRNRHREPQERPDSDRLRYFTQPADGKPTTRHRRRRADAAAPESGRIPSDPTRSPGRRGMTPAEPGEERVTRPRRIRGDGGAVDPGSQRMPPRRTPPPGPPPRADPSATDGFTAPRARPESIPPASAPHREARPPRREPRRSGAASREGAEPLVAGGRGGPHAAGEAAVGTGAGVGRDRPQSRAERRVRADARVSDAAAPGFAAGAGDDGTSASGDPAVQRRRRAYAVRRRRRRILITAVLLLVLVLLLGVAFLGLRGNISRYFESAEDYTNASGVEDVLVEIPDNSTLSDFGQILEENGVVGSVRAFIDAADGQAMSGGFYKLRTEIPAQVAVRMLTEGNNHRVGRIVVPEGLQLENKEGIDGQTTPGIFQMIANQTTIDINDDELGVSIEQLTEAAANASAEDLGVPAWAEEPVQNLTGNYRRIEGLIAPGTWESIDPRQSPTEILHGLITQSTQIYEQWGIAAGNSSGLSPYETLIVASIIGGEVQEVDYSKVARVIVNRLDVNQRLEMDSTINYTADVTNIDVFGESFTADNPWNTYRNEGLPPTPIGSVGEQVLAATENPEPGSWLYFVTIDRQGTTLFADTYEQHIRNREEACRSGLIATGCA